MTDVTMSKGENFPIKHIKYWKDRKEIYNKFKKNQGVLYYKVYPIKEEVKKEVLLALVDNIITSQQLDKKSDNLDMDGGERTFTIVFNNPQSLIAYIKHMDENLSIF